MRVEILGLNFLIYFIVSYYIRVVKANANCVAPQGTCEVLPCDGVWDNTNSVCNDCSLDQTTCETSCLRRWINSACAKKCTNAVNSTECTACYGLWDAVGNKCYDCMQDQSTCTDVCNRFWINGKCWDCNASSVNCLDATTCNGEWVAATTTCNVCWPSQSHCNKCNRFWDTSTPPSVCVNCQLDQATCETANKCNGYWNAGTSFCTLCFLNQANCIGTQCNGAWNGVTNTCSNCNNDARQCTNCLMNYLYGQCVDCNSGFNTCTNIKYCNGEWNTPTCTICSTDQATCETTGAGNCNGTWIAATSRCDKCKNSLTECTKCQLNWIPGVPNTCLDCNKDLATCQNTAVCNGVWNASTSKCQICNLDSGTCSSCPNLRRWDPVTSTNLCFNCYTDSVTCGKCLYFWVPSNANYDGALQNTCINCNVSEEVCTSKKKCNGIWDTINSVCSQQCNVNTANCTACGGVWNAAQSLCDVCSKSQAECNICNNQWVKSTCTNCQASSGVCTSQPCGGIWTSTAAIKCLVCNENSTNCKSCGGFWKNTECLQCDLNEPTCTNCGGIYSTTDSKCILKNDKYTCYNQLTAYMKEPYWNGVKCVDCQESQYMCNKECFRVWTNQSCSTTSCDLDQYTCESLCFLNWNYYQSKCYFNDIKQNSICAISNDSVVLNGKCIQCHVSQDLCENQCNQAYTPNGLRVWVNSKCTDCQKDSNTCTNVCKMDWIAITVGATTQYVCIKCNSDAYNCSMCQGQWNSVTSTCGSTQTYCNASSTNCANDCTFIPALQFNYKSSKCYYCNLNQFTCETACKSLWLPRLQYCEVLTTQDECQLNNRGYWDSVAGVCQLCNNSSTDCTTCKSDNIWDPVKQVCLNINLGQAYCDQMGESYVWVTDTMSATYGISLANGRCISCHLNSNVCTTACKRSWSGSICYTCNYDKTICEGSCGKDWILPNICVKCSTNATTCTNTCDWYWDSLTSTCINCNLNQPNCENASKCNGIWNTGTNTCDLCNKSVANCEQKCYFVYSTQSSSCINCQTNQSSCEQQCGYVWDPTLASNKCILCNQSEAICTATGTYKCNGFWLATKKCTQYKCNQDQSTCENKCLMKWNSKLSLCKKCTQTQYEDLGTGNCLECNTLTSLANCNTNCAANQFFWDTTIVAATKCRECTATEYWDGTKCVLCTTIDPKCSKCQKVGATPTCLGCSNNFRVKSATLCSCDNDRIPDALGVCQLCSVLISNCATCSVLGTCGTCNQGYSWDTTNAVCRAKFSFTSNTLSGIAFVTDFTVTLSYPNANNPTNAAIVYAIYLYDSITDYNNELSNFLQQKITVGVLYQTKLAESSKYFIKLKSGKPVLAPLLILNGQVIPPEDQILEFTVKKQFSYIDQFTKYINEMMNILTPKDFYYKQYSDELVNQYYSNACSSCPTGTTCITNKNQCNCDTLGTGMTLYDCSGLDNTQFDLFVSTLFSYFKDTSSQAQSASKLKDLMIHLNTLGNESMNVDLFQFYTGLIPGFVSGKTSPTASDNLNFIDIIRRVVTYTDYMMENSLAKTADKIYVPHDKIQSAIIAVLNTRNTYELESFENTRLSAAAVSSISSLITTIDMYKLQYATEDTKPKIYQSSSNLAIGGNIKAARFFYNTNPFFIGNSTFSNYKNYPYVEYFVYEKSGLVYNRKNVEFTFIYTVTDIKQSIKCAYREGDYLQLCSKTDINNSKMTITCTCSNSGTLIEKTILVEPNIDEASSDNYLLYIILGCSLGGALVIFLGFLFVYLKKQALTDRFKILKKQKDGTRGIDPNLSLSDYDLEIKE